MTIGQFSNSKFCVTIVLDLEASFYYCGCVLGKDIIMGKDTKRDMGKEELEAKVKKLSPEEQAFVKRKDVPKRFNRTSDAIFKYYFGKEGNEELLLSLINGLLSANTGEDKDFWWGKVPKPNYKFTSVELLGTESAPLDDGTKGIRFDVVAKTNDGQHVNVEIQNCKQSYLVKRSLFYWANMFVKFNEQGKPYTDIKPAIAIWVCNHILDSPRESEYVIRAVTPVFRDQHVAASDAMDIYFVQLPKMKLSDYKALRERGIMTLEAESWTRFLASDSSDGWEAMNAMSPGIARKLQQQEKEFWSDEAQRYAYIVADDQERVRLTDRELALEEGRKEGREQGLVEKEQELVFDMLSVGFSDEQITALPSITKEKLEKYKKAYKK